MSRGAAVAVVAAVLVIGCQRPESASSADAAPAIAISFRGVWYSESEMRRLGQGETDVSPTAPIELKAWEYTDPIGSPHPDIVEVAIAVTPAADAAAREVRVGLREQWLIGGAEGPSTATWQDPLPPRQLDTAVRLSPGTTTDVRMPVAIGDMVRSLGAADRYPWRLRVLVSLDDASSQQALAMAEGELPIIPGD